MSGKDHLFSLSEIQQITDVMSALEDQIHKWNNGEYGDAPDTLNTVIAFYRPGNVKIGEVLARDDRALFDPNAVN